MTNRPSTPPEWFDEALRLKAEGYSVRAISEHLSTEGRKVSRTSVWHWVTAAGRRDIRHRNTDAYRLKLREYQRRHQAAKRD